MASTVPKQIVVGDTPSDEVRLLRISFNNLLEVLAGTSGNGADTGFAAVQTALNAAYVSQKTSVFKVVDQRENPQPRRYPTK